VTDDRDEEEQDQPRLKITDKRRVGRGAGSGAGSEPATELEAADASEEEAAGAVESDLDRLTREASEYREHLQRLQAEFENYRKRTQREQALASELGAAPVVVAMLEVVDDFELALMAAEREPDFEQFRRGVELVFAKLADTLRKAGVERMDAEGKPFDPEQHEALMQEGDGDGDPVVADVLRPGYTLKGRVIRPAGVKVVRH
jgi:molecular chaperone GrpE